MRKFGKRLALGLAALLSAAPAHAGGGGGFGGIVFDPSNFAKNTITAAQSLEATIQRATQIANQLQQIQYQIQSLRKLPESVWPEALDALNALADVVRTANGISYALQDLDRIFRERYPGYVAPEDYGARYRLWTDTTLDSIRGALNAAGLHADQFADEQAQMETLRSLSDNAEGQVAAIQAGNQIAMQTVAQLQKLRQLQMAQMQAQNAYMSLEVQRRASDQAILDRALAKGAPYTPPERPAWEPSPFGNWR